MTLQEQFNSIKNGKGNKDQFLKQARHTYPQYLTKFLDFDTSVNILKSKQLINEAIGGVVTKGYSTYDWKKILEQSVNSMSESTKASTTQVPKLADLKRNYKLWVKEKHLKLNHLSLDQFAKAKKLSHAQHASIGDDIFFVRGDYKGYSINEAEVKSEEKEVSKEVKDANKNAYDNKNVKNADNINFNEILKGYLAELGDPKNAGKTGDELKDIVVKNLAKDCLHYTKDGMFGVKGVGFTDEAPGLGKNTQPTSKNASVLGGRSEVNSESDIVKNSLVGSAKKNVQDSLGDKEAKDSMPKKVKEMTATPQNSAGVKKMKMPGAEKKMKLQEGIINDTNESKIRSVIAKIIQEELKK